MLAQSKHAVEGCTGIFSGTFLHRYLVDHAAFGEVLERPQQVQRRDAEHGRAYADTGVEGDYLVIPQFLGKPVYQVNFGSYRPGRTGFGGSHRANDPFGRTDLVGGLRDLETAFRMNDDPDTRVLPADPFDVRRGEALMHRAVALPQDHLRFLHSFRGVASEFLVRVPHHHAVQRNPHAKTGIAAQMLVRKKQYFVAALKGPLHDRSGVGTGTDQTAMLAGERLDGSGRIHVGHGDDLCRVGNVAQLRPARFHLADIG